MKQLVTGIALAVWLAFGVAPTAAQEDQINGQSIYRPPRLPPPIFAPEVVVPTEADAGEATEEFEASAEASVPTFAVPPTPTPNEIMVNADYTARAAVVGDSTRLADFATGSFLPSAIPVEGQPFFESDARANLQANGSAIRLNAYGPRSYAFNSSLHAQIEIVNLTVPTDAFGETDFAVKEIYGTLNQLTVGVTESAFADPSAVPETLDRAGPNARLTVFDAGTGSGQGVLRYDLLTPEPDGLEIVFSLEQALPEVIRPAADRAFAHVPDLVCATQYVVGDWLGETPQFYERWHVQWATVFRDVGVESPNGDDQSEFGWGTAVSGAYRFRVNPRVTPLDRVMVSAAYGRGYSHYITDLNAATDAGDGIVNVAGGLETLPAFAGYIGYTHQWTECLRSTATVSHVNLESTLPLGATVSPYRYGNFFAVNLVYHVILSPDVGGERGERFYSGLEYLFGQKETLDGSNGDAHRLMFVVALRK